MLQDLRFAFRSLRKRPGFALLAVLTIALGIGVNVSMFTIADGVLWKPLPYSESERLVKFSEMSGSGLLNCSYPNAEDWKGRSTAFEDIALERPFPLVALRLTGSVENVNAGFAHPNLFSVLRVQPVLGRLFTAEEDGPGGEPPGVITDQAWERYFGRDPMVIGRHVRALAAMEGQQADSIVMVFLLSLSSAGKSFEWQFSQRTPRLKVNPRIVSVSSWFEMVPGNTCKLTNLPGVCAIAAAESVRRHRRHSGNRGFLPAGRYYSALAPSADDAWSLQEQIQCVFFRRANNRGCEVSCNVSMLESNLVR
jgi:hypothetical protein